MSESADEDLRDVFRLLYDDADWASDDEAVTETPRVVEAEPEIEQVEVELDENQRYLERYSRKRFLDDLQSLVGRSTKRQRVYNPSSSKSTASVSTPVASTSAFPTLPPPSTYAPYSPLPLLSRLRTFHPSSYSPFIPAALDAVQAALHGWTNYGTDTLSCGLCRGRWDLSGVSEIMDESVRTEVAKRMRAGLVKKHEPVCAWRIRYCSGTLYERIRHILHPSTASSLSVLAARIELECLGHLRGNLGWTGPLGVNRESVLVKRLQSANTTPGDISTIAAALALFCWYPFHPNGPLHTVSLDTDPRRTEIVQCRLCERRVGLWAFRGEVEGQPDKAFDLVGEHLSWCPIRDQETAKGRWWDNLPILSERKGAVSVEKGWLRVSERLQIKPWRRSGVTDIPPG